MLKKYLFEFQQLILLIYFYTFKFKQNKNKKINSSKINNTSHLENTINNMTLFLLKFFCLLSTWKIFRIRVT